MQNSKGGLGSKEVHSARLVRRRYSLGIDGGGAGLLKRLAALPGTLLPYVAAFGQRVLPLLDHGVRLRGELRPVFLDGVARGLVRALVELGSHAAAAGVRPTKTVTGTV